MLLGGEIRLTSVHGQGSTFTLYLPLRYTSPVDGARQRTGRARRRAPLAVLPVAREEQIDDDRNAIEDGDPVLLIIEDDPHHARILLGLARDKGFKVIVATKGATGLSLARQYRPTAISLDIYLARHARLDRAQQLEARPGHAAHPRANHHGGRGAPDRSWRMARSPTSSKSPTTEGMEAAFDRLKDFTAPRTKRLLVVEDNDIERQSIVELLGHSDIELDGRRPPAMPRLRGAA